MCSETTVVTRTMPVAGPVSFTSPCLCAKPSYRGLANPPQCQTALGLIAKPLCVQRGPLDTCLNLLMCPHGGLKTKFKVDAGLGRSLACLSLQ